MTETTDSRAGSRRDTFTIAGMDCGECASRIDKAVSRLPGVCEATTAFAASRLSVEYDPDQLSADEIRAHVRRLGYEVREDGHDHNHGETPTVKRVAVVVAAGLLLLIGAILLKVSSPVVARAFFGASIVVGGWNVFRSAYASLRAHMAMDIHVLMAIAVVGAVAIGQWEEGAAVLVLYSIGEWLEGYTVDRTRGSIRALMALAPPTARVVSDVGETVVPSEEVVPGVVIRVRPGERIALDGDVSAGHSSVDQAAITGESVPVEKRVGDAVFAGTLNGDGVLDITVTRSEGDSTVARIVEMVRAAQEKKAPAERLVDRFSRYYTPAVIALAVTIALFGPLVFSGTFREWFYRALALLVAACPCALVISTPVAIVAALGRAARRGILIKDGAALEAVGAVDIVAMDKTGTLTEGVPVVTDVVAADGVDADAMFSVAAALEAHSSHPLAGAVRRRAADLGIAPPEVSGFMNVPGRGVRGTVEGVDFWIGSLASIAEAQPLPEHLAAAASRLEEAGKTVLVLTAEQGPMGLLAVRDRPRDAAATAVAELRKAGISRVVMLTGDAERPARAIAAVVGVTDVRAGLLPGHKKDAVEELEREGRVAMVGDGVNDAPALAAASVGIAMGAVGSDAAVEAADIALMGDDLFHLEESIRLGRDAMHVIRQNVGIALGLKVLFVAAVLLGWATLWMAVLADTGASVLVTLNAMRLMRDVRAANG